MSRLKHLEIYGLRVAGVAGLGSKIHKFLNVNLKIQKFKHFRVFKIVRFRDLEIYGGLA